MDRDPLLTVAARLWSEGRPRIILGCPTAPGATATTPRSPPAASRLCVSGVCSARTRRGTARWSVSSLVAPPGPWSPPSCATPRRRRLDVGSQPPRQRPGARWPCRRACTCRHPAYSCTRHTTTLSPSRGSDFQLLLPLWGRPRTAPLSPLPASPDAPAPTVSPDRLIVSLHPHADERARPRRLRLVRSRAAAPAD